MKKIVISIVLAIQCSTIFCQVITRRNAVDYLSKHNIVYSSNVKPIDIDVTNNNSEELSIGTRVFSSLGLSDGDWSVINDSLIVWKIGIRIEEAEFISVIFSNLSISHGDELYIYTPSKQYIDGTIY